MGYRVGRLRSRRTRLRVLAVAALSVAALTSAGCGSESPAAQDQTVDLGKLDTGSYATRPQDPKAADPASRSRVIEALRLGDVVPLPSEIDPALTHSTHGPHVLLQGNLFDGFVKTDHFDADTPGFIAGFATGAQTMPNTGLYSLDAEVMIFDSDGDAANAAAALARTGLSVDDDKRADVVALPPTKYPQQQLRWDSKRQLLASWYSTGRFVMFHLVHNPESFYLQKYWNSAPDPAPVALVDKAIDLTADRLKSFQATPPEKIADLPVDPQGMLALTLARPEGDPTPDAFTGTLDRHGALHDVEDSALSQALFDQAGVDLVSYGAGQLVRTHDAGAARNYLDTAFADRLSHPLAPPTGLPSARCVKYNEPGRGQFPFVCHVAFDRYVASVWSQQLQDVYQRVSAQYAILANNQK
ncbi:DUF7373 family lipoprotein [Nocardia heshunensis]